MAFYFQLLNQIHMAELKTKPNKGSVTTFISSLENEDRRKDSKTLVALMKKLTGEKPVLWGPSIVGFGDYRYKYASGREGDWFLIGFSPRKQNMTLYIMDGFKKYGDLLKKLGPYTTGASCLYVKRLADIDMNILSEMIASSVEFNKNRKM